jgi:periplasmic divalent cation tolerance protein
VTAGGGDHVVALSTVAKSEDAQRLARALVEQRLAACVNVIPGLTSVYRWKDKIESDAEHLLVIKTRRERVDALKRALVSLHPYELPELIVLPIEGGHLPYLAWVDENVAGAEP